MTLPAGARLGPYEIVDLIGRGGMGEVYRARDERLEREVAIKILPPHLSAHSEALKRFRREARAVAALSHPNIVALFDTGDSPEGPYVVTELLDGETLRSRMRRGALSMDDTLRIAVAIADGLGAAHAKNIIHRDLKPENVILTAGGGVKILDFGLAATQRPVAGAASGPAGSPPGSAIQTDMLTEPGLVIGTIGYMAPEQLRGRPLTTACDVFALGCVTYEMLRGEMPFQEGSNFDVIASVLRDDPLACDARDMPSEVRAVLERCLVKDPDKRYPNGTEAAAALREVLRKHDDGHLSTMKTTRVPQRGPLGSMAILIAIGLIAIIGTVTAWIATAPRREVIDGGYDLRGADVTGSADVRRLLSLALHADAAGDRPKAIELCRETARIDSRTPLPAAFAASFYFHNGDPQRGLEWSREAAQRLQRGSWTTYETLLARYLLPENETQLDMALSSSMLELHPDAWRLRLSLAHVHLSRRELPAMFTQLKLIDPSRPDDRRLAIVLADRASLGDLAGARHDLERSHLMRSPALLAYARGRMAWSRGDAAEAARQYDAAVENATANNLPSVAMDSLVLAGIARVGKGDFAGAESTFEVAVVKAREASEADIELQAQAFGAYVAMRLGDRGGMARRLRAAALLADPGTANQEELKLISLRLNTDVRFREGNPVYEGDMLNGVASLIAAREALHQGDAAGAAQLLGQARSEGIDATWFAEEAALLDADLGTPGHVTFKADPPYPNRLRFIPVWELARAAAHR